MMMAPAVAPAMVMTKVMTKVMGMTTMMVVAKSAGFSGAGRH
jgi:hypothetical protein